MFVRVTGWMMNGGERVSSPTTLEMCIEEDGVRTNRVSGYVGIWNGYYETKAFTVGVLVL